MFKSTLKTLFAVGALFAATSASAGYTTATGGGSLNFDDLGSTTGVIANGYQGLDWSNFSYMNAPYSNATYGAPNGYDTVANADSPPNVATNSLPPSTTPPNTPLGLTTSAFWTADLQNFASVDFRIGSVSSDNMVVTINGYEYNGSSLGSVVDSLTVNLLDPFAVYNVLLSGAGWDSTNYIQFVVTTPGTYDTAVPFNTVNAFAIDTPEPTQAALLLMGLPLLAAVSRRRPQIAA
jgi:hypothetical protein